MKILNKKLPLPIKIFVSYLIVLGVLGQLSIFVLWNSEIEFTQPVLRISLLPFKLNFVPLANAEEFKSDKRFNAGELVKEVETATGLDLEGKDQIGYMSTKMLYNDDFTALDGTIIIKLKDRDLTADEKAKIENTIKKHIYVDPEEIEKVKKDKAKQELRSLGVSEESIKTIMKE